MSVNKEIPFSRISFIDGSYVYLKADGLFLTPRQACSVAQRLFELADQIENPDPPPAGRKRLTLAERIDALTVEAAGTLTLPPLSTDAQYTMTPAEMLAEAMGGRR